MIICEQIYGKIMNNNNDFLNKSGAGRLRGALITFRATLVKLCLLTVKLILVK